MFRSLVLGVCVSGYVCVYVVADGCGVCALDCAGLSMGAGGGDMYAPISGCFDR